MGRFIKTWELIRARAQLRLDLVWCGIAAVSLWFRTAFPVYAAGPTPNDDALFVKEAVSLASGHWLGPYNELTLSKGMFYSFFIAVAKLCAIPLVIAEQLLYLSVSALVARFVGKQANQPGLGLLLFVLLAFNPEYWTPALARTAREAIYGSLALGLVTLAAMLAFSERSFRSRLILSVWTGLAAAAFWLTREEGPWILPALAVVVAIAAAGLFFSARPGAGGGGPARYAAFGIPLASAFLVCVGVIAFQASINLVRYGVFENTEFQAGDFPKAYGALASIGQDKWRRYVVFPKDARQRAYAVSPAARELKPYLEGPLGETWRAIGCSQTETKDCPEVLSGWFMWELKDAVNLAGHGQTAVDTQDFYQRLAEEVKEGCDRRAIPCLSSPMKGFVPRFRTEYLREAIAPARVLAGMMFKLGGDSVGLATSVGNDDNLAPFRDMAGPIAPLGPPVGKGRIVGWVAASDEVPVLTLRSGGNVNAQQTLSAASDVEQVYPMLHSQRFLIEADCPPNACSLVVTTKSAPPLVLPWDQLRAGGVVDQPALKMFLDKAEINVPVAPTVTQRFQDRQRAVAAWIGRGYARLFPLLSIAGLLGLTVALVLRPWSPGASWGLVALSAASLAALTSRIGILAYLDATSMPSTNLTYVSPGMPFVIVFAFTGIYVGWRALAGVLAGRREPLDAAAS